MRAPRIRPVVCCALGLWGGLLPGLALAAAPTNPATTNLVWPPPPAEPRIAWVQNIAGPLDLGLKPSGLGKIASWFTGGPDPVALVKPAAVAVDAAGNLVIADPGGPFVCYFDAARRKWLRWDKAGDAAFRSPVSAALAGDNIYIADSALGQVLVLNPRGKRQFVITRELQRPTGLAVHKGDLFVADAAADRIARFTLRGEFVSAFGRRGAGAGEFHSPTHVAVDAAGQIYVTDALNFRVQVFATDGIFRRQIGRSGDTSGSFSRPKGVAVDRFGQIYVVDALFDNVQVFDAAGRFLLDLGSGGSAPGEFWLPAGIATGPGDRIYVADAYNHRLQVLKYLGTP